MKALRIQAIDGFDIVCGVGRAVENPVVSKRKAQDTLGPDATYYELLNEALRNPVYFHTIPNEENVSNEEGDRFKSRLQSLQRHEKLTRGGEVIADNRGRVWFLLEEDWSRGMIDSIGETLPDGAVWAEDLTASQVSQIKGQEGHRAIAAMPIEDRRLAADREIRGAKREAVQLRSEAEITGESEALSDAQSFYKSQLARILTKYRLPDARKDG